MKVSSEKKKRRQKTKEEDKVVRKDKIIKRKILEKLWETQALLHKSISAFNKPHLPAGC